ncbi:MAG: hypothetical protein H0T85_06935 [Geodermatophilaceae bacterium]|nr:hypothetical protein [Geodermatophilaceae bacterium]
MSDERTVRAVSGALAVWGAVQVAAPGRLLTVLGADRPSPPLAIVRVLGVRMLAQHLAVLAAPQRSLVLGSAAVDTLHGASMLAAAVIWPRYRRAALISAGTAFASTATAVLTGRR